MSYTALYRKYRPAAFSDVRGQDHIVTTLKNQIKADRIGHAYLFCGTRGTGKTTAAKIFARAVNCESPTDGSPCGECASCRAVAAGTSVNVIEIDAASNNGVESIREIREEVTYRPTQGRYRVYIIDEVHMLSIGAFNALLKTLEEPPSYVIFILATTEAHKIPVTILSRCQRYDFHRISVDTIQARLQELLLQEQVCAEEKALRYIAASADGALRDALSLLDQCIAFYPGQTLTYDNVLNVLGAVDTDVFADMLEKTLSRDVSAVIGGVEKLVADGRELSQFLNDFIWYLRNLLLVKCSDGGMEILDMSSESIARLKQIAQTLEEETLIRCIRIFSELSGQMRYSSQKRTLLEIALIKLCRPQMEQDCGSLAMRIDQLEQKAEQGLLSMPPQSDAVGINAPDAPQSVPVLPKAVPEDVAQAVKEWKRILASMPGVSKSYLGKAKLSLGRENELLLVFTDTMAAGYFSREEERLLLEEAIAKQIGRQVAVVVQEQSADRPFEETHVDLEQLIHMEITYEA